MKNLDLIKNINKQNRLASNKRRRSHSGAERRYPVRSATAASPTMSQTNKSFDMPKNNRKSRQSNLEHELGKSLYDSKLHAQVGGYYYDSNSGKIPNFYQRPGPGSYQQDQTMSTEQQLSTLSKYQRPPGQKIGK